VTLKARHAEPGARVFPVEDVSVRGTEELAIPQVTHGLEYMNPRAVADGLALFFASHKL